MYFRSASAGPFFLLSISHLVRAQGALQIVNIDDGDPRITYSPQSSWQLATDGPGIDAGGTHMVTTDPGATAMIKYTFVNFFFFAPKWPYKVTTDISIDGGAPVTLDLQDHNTPVTALGSSATLPSAVVCSFDGNGQSAEHTIVLSVHPGDQFAVVDIFFVLPNTTTTTSSSSSVPTSSATDTTSATSTIISTSPTSAPSNTSSPAASSPAAFMSGSHVRLPTGALVGLIVLSLMIVVLFLLLVVICHRRRSHRPSRRNTFDENNNPGLSGPVNNIAADVNRVVDYTSAFRSSSSVDLLVHTENKNSESRAARLFISNPDPLVVSSNAVAPAQYQSRPPSAYSSVLPSYVSRALSLRSFSAEPKFFTDTDPESDWLASDPVIPLETERERMLPERGSTGPNDFDGEDVCLRSLPPSYDCWEETPEGEEGSDRR
ncbi:hypothetical protein BDN70DRAFT_936836 [Pholiota conissans]|uniref:Uncharacterized protein n=1 Tax=Pholiota conissans TaxID=109636 RepID=A0A9P6CPQ4_9AGAR|nr:hypothetical protein BDN70DRAFT_936836 [Pholiota conissans]